MAIESDLANIMNAVDNHETHLSSILWDFRITNLTIVYGAGRQHLATSLPAPGSRYRREFFFSRRSNSHKVSVHLYSAQLNLGLRFLGHGY